MLVSLHLTQNILQPRVLASTLLDESPAKLVLVNRKRECFDGGDMLTELMVAKLGKTTHISIFETG